MDNLKNRARRLLHKVFVYGSLKKGFINDGLLNDSQFVGKGETSLKKYTMFNLGAFPAVALGGTDSIKGEVYAVNGRTLAQLDRLEGNGHFYTRKPTRVGEEICWMYIINTPNQYRLIHDETVPNGNWKLNDESDFTLKNV
ncbi:gamma-glutamylcyclotransferase [bacterium]|nr:gamma-glutamylcyclotransferase [bacterium]